MEKRRLTEEHITLLNNRIQNGTESHEDDKSIAQIQDRIFAGQFFTKKDREEHRVCFHFLSCCLVSTQLHSRFLQRCEWLTTGIVVMPGRLS